jgi:hypothetical protein
MDGYFLDIPCILVVMMISAEIYIYILLSVQPLPSPPSLNDCKIFSNAVWTVWLKIWGWSCMKSQRFCMLSNIQLNELKEPCNFSQASSTSSHTVLKSSPIAEIYLDNFKYFLIWRQEALWCDILIDHIEIMCPAIILLLNVYWLPQ